MVTSDTTNSYKNGIYTGNSNVQADLWNYGAEVWCNKEGQYVTLVADRSSNSVDQSYEMSLCALGIFGAEYTRSSSLPERI